MALVAVAHKALAAAGQSSPGLHHYSCRLVIETATVFFVLRPLNTVARDAQRIAQGNLEHRIEWHSRDSFGVIAGELSRMAVRLGELRDTEAGRRQMEFQLSDAVLQSIFEPIIVTDSKGHVLKLNQAAAELLGEAAGDRMALTNTPGGDKFSVQFATPSRCRRRWPPKAKHRCCRCASASWNAATACARRQCATRREGCWAP